MTTPRPRAVTAALCTLALLSVAPSAFADTSDAGGFETYNLGDPLGQDGWMALDIPAYTGTDFDIDIVDASPTWGTALGTRALRISNAVTSGGFSNQLQSPSTVDEAGESAAEDAPSSGGTRQQRVSGTIRFASAVPASEQVGLVVGFAPDSGDGTRMSHFRVYDLPTGLQVSVVVYDPITPAFTETVLATGLDRTQVHTFNFSIDFVDGIRNDVLTADFDACTFSTVGTWEDYHRDNFPGGTTKPVDSLLFRQAGAAVPGNLGGGILFDEVSLTTGPTPPAPPVPAVPSAPTGVVVAGSEAAAVLSATAPTVHPCAPVTTYTLTATPSDGGAPVVITSASPSFSLASLPVGVTYSLVLSATNRFGASVLSAPISFDRGGGLAATGSAASLHMALSVLLLSTGALLILEGRRRRTTLA